MKLVDLCDKIKYDISQSEVNFKKKITCDLDHIDHSFVELHNDNGPERIQWDTEINDMWRVTAKGTLGLFLQVTGLVWIPFSHKRAAVFSSQEVQYLM